MATATVPMYDPQGTVRDVPFEQLKDAVANGGVPAHPVQAPDGKTRMVPVTRLNEAAQNGGKILPLQSDESHLPAAYGFTLKNLASNAWEGAKGMATGTYALGKDLVQNPNWVEGKDSTLNKFVFKPADAEAEKAKDLWNQGHYTEAMGHGLAAAVPLAGPAAAEIGEQAGSGDVGGALAKGVGQVAAGAAVAKTASAIPKVADVTRSVGERVTPKQAAQAVAATTALATGHGGPYSLIEGGAGGHLAGKAAELVLGKERANQPIIARDATKQNVPYAGEDEPVASAQAKPAAAPQPAAAASPETAATADTSPKNVERLLGEATGAKPLQPKVALRNQATATATKTASLPADFTPVKSSALQGYKYDPQTQELTSITNNGQTYKHSGVTPDMMAAFEEAKSKGQAWNMVRKGPGVTLIEKNGTPVVKSSYRSASPEDATPGDVDRPSPKPASVPAASPKAASRTAAETPTSTNAKSGAAGSPDEDLTALLNESLKQVQRTKSGVEHVSADPAKLVEEWGVDEDSLKNTREQTRGMSPEETEAYTQKLADAYKKGFPVEPLLETRDQYGNILEVDGRQRAIAAQRAGIKQVPVMRRYLKK